METFETYVSKMLDDGGIFDINITNIHSSDRQNKLGSH